VKVSQQTDGPKCDQAANNNNNNDEDNNNIIWFSHFLHRCVMTKIKQYFGTKGYGQTDRQVLADIVIKIKKETTFLVMHVAEPKNRNAIQKDAEKIFKYKNMSTELQVM
jgi:hypothetical protein